MILEYFMVVAYLINSPSAAISEVLCILYNACNVSTYKHIHYAVCSFRSRYLLLVSLPSLLQLCTEVTKLVVTKVVGQHFAYHRVTSMLGILDK